MMASMLILAFTFTIGFATGLFFGVALANTAISKDNNEKDL